MDRKMKARVANATAKAKRIRAERKRTDPYLCESCGGDSDDHKLSVEIREGGEVWLVSGPIIPKEKLN